MPRTSSLVFSVNSCYLSCDICAVIQTCFWPKKLKSSVLQSTFEPLTLTQQPTMDRNKQHASSVL